MERFVSQPLPHPRTHGEGTEITRADLVFYGIDPIGKSYVARIFLDSPEADVTTPLDTNDSFAGWFTVFGHGGCFGDDDDHCAPPDPAASSELRIPVGIPRQTKTVTITDALERVTEPTFTVTLVAVVPGDDQATAADVLRFNGLRLVTYN